MRKIFTLIACGMLHVTSHSQKITDVTKSLFQQKIDYFLQPELIKDGFPFSAASCYEIGK